MDQRASGKESTERDNPEYHTLLRCREYVLSSSTEGYITAAQEGEMMQRQEKC